MPFHTYLCHNTPHITFKNTIFILFIIQYVEMKRYLRRKEQQQQKKKITTLSPFPTFYLPVHATNGNTINNVFH
jgi:hypothetical protein